MSSQKKPHKKMKLEDLQPKAPELTVPNIEKVTKEFWQPLRDMVNNDLPQVFIRLKESIAFINKIQPLITEPEIIHNINQQANNIIKDSEPLMTRWSELKQDIENKTSSNMMPEEALALSFTYQAELEQWLEDATVIINTPLDNLLDYASSKIKNPEESVK